MDWWKNTLVLSSKRKIVLEWLELEIVLEQTLLSFLLLSLRLLIDAAQKKQSMVRNLDVDAIYTSTAKTFKQTFSSRLGTFVWWYVHLDSI